MKEGKGLVPPSAGPSGRLRSCPQGHETCWPFACPVCLARRLYGKPRVTTPRPGQSEAMKAYWRRRKAAEAAL